MENQLVIYITFESSPCQHLESFIANRWTNCSFSNSHKIPCFPRIISLPWKHNHIKMQSARIYYSKELFYDRPITCPNKLHKITHYFDWYATNCEDIMPFYWLRTLRKPQQSSSSTQPIRGQGESRAILVKQIAAQVYHYDKAKEF